MIVVILGAIVVHLGCRSKREEENGGSSCSRGASCSAYYNHLSRYLGYIYICVTWVCCRLVLCSGGSEASLASSAHSGQYGHHRARVQYGLLCCVRNFARTNVLWLLRLRIFAEEHDTMLERALLPSAMEIDPAEITIGHPIGAGGYG